MNSTAQEYIIAADRCEEVGLTVAAAALRRAARRMEMPDTFQWRNEDGTVSSHIVERYHAQQVVHEQEIRLANVLPIVHRTLVTDTIHVFDPRFPILLRFGKREPPPRSRDQLTFVTLDAAGVPAQET